MCWGVSVCYTVCVIIVCVLGVFCVLYGLCDQVCACVLYGLCDIVCAWKGLCFGEFLCGIWLM